MGTTAPVGAGVGGPKSAGPAGEAVAGLNNPEISEINWVIGLVEGVVPEGLTLGVPTVVVPTTLDGRTGVAAF